MQILLAAADLRASLNESWARSGKLVTLRLHVTTWGRPCPLCCIKAGWLSVVGRQGLQPLILCSSLHWTLSQAKELCLSNAAAARYSSSQAAPCGADIQPLPPAKQTSERTGRVREAKILGTWTLQFTQLFLRMIQV